MSPFGHATDFFTPLLEAKLSPTTQRVYMERLRTIMQAHRDDLFTILTSPKKYIAWIESNFQSLATRKSYLSAILAVFRHNNGLKEQEKKHYLVWYEAFRTIHEEIDERYKRNEPSDKQIQGYVPFEDIIAKRDELDAGSLEKLLLGFYTYIPPLRCDLNRVRIYRQTSMRNPEEQNYILLNEAKEEATLVLREFKTASRQHEYEKELPKELVHETVASLRRDPRMYLFEDRHHQPYRASSFTKWANRTLQRLFEKHLTISLIRHSFINSLDFNRLTVQEKEEIAKDMAHTVGTQDRYRLIFNP